MPKTEPTVGRDRPAHEWIYATLDDVAASRLRPGRLTVPTEWEQETRALAAPRLDATVRNTAMAYAFDLFEAALLDLGERYVMAINAVLCAPAGSGDVDRWRGHAESARTIAEWWCRKLDLDPSLCAFGTKEWRAANGVYSDAYVASLRAGGGSDSDTALTLAPEGFDDV